jgi:PDZ domain/Aspartyl protease
MHQRGLLCLGSADRAAFCEQADVDSTSLRMDDYANFFTGNTMLKSAAALLAFTCLVSPAWAAPGVDAVLAANKAATGGPAWDSKVTLKIAYNYSGQGLKGTQSTLEDLQRGAFVDAYDIGPTSGATGFDGSKAWEKEPSGTVTNQAGGDVIPLAVSEAYQDQNLWWRADRGGAQIVDDGGKSDVGQSYDVLTVTPKGGKPFDAWFDAKTRLLSRTIEIQGTQTITTFYSDYVPTDGGLIAHKQVIDDGSGASNRQTITVTSATFSPALPWTAFSQPAEHLSDYAIAGGAVETTVPFQLLNNHIYADVSVNGSKPMPFIFDTGGHSILTPETAKLLAVNSQGAQTSTGGGEGTAQSGVGTVKSLSVGGVTLTNQPITVLTFSPPGVEGVNEAGMLGYELFARFVTRIDYGAHTLTFFDKAHFDPKDAGTPVPMRLYHQFPEVLGSYDGIPGRFGIDTGARTPLVLTRGFVEENDLRARATTGAVALTGWGVGGPTRSFVTRGGLLQLGDVKIEHPLTLFATDKGGAFAAAAFPNNVGGGILKRFVVTFDYDHNLMYLKPIAEPVADLDAFDRSGIWINQIDGGVKIFDVTKGGPAEQAGLAKGDEIVAVDGKPANAVPLSELRQQLRDGKPGTAVTFTIKAGTGTKTVAVTLRDLI